MLASHLARLRASAIDLLESANRPGTRATRSGTPASPSALS